jgi:hypothetical protein
VSATLTRRQWLRLGAGALLSLGAWPGRLRGEDAPAHDDFDFIAVNFPPLAFPVTLSSAITNHLSDTDRSAYEQIFPNQINYAFDHRGWQIIGLDSSEGTKATETRISAKTFDWLDENIPRLDARRPTIVFTHFPLGEGVFARPLNADDLLCCFYEFNVQGVFCGHFHGYTARPFHQASVTTDKCCSRVRPNHDGTPEKGWFVCRASRGEVKRRFVEFQQ